MKNCLFCTHFHYISGQPDYGEYTPGSDISIGCGLNLWELDNTGDTEDDFRRKMISAETCAHYDDQPLIGPFEEDMVTEVIRVVERRETDKTRNPKYMAKFQSARLAKLHNMDRAVVEVLAGLCTAAAEPVAPLFRRQEILNVIESHKRTGQ